jgi:hypothetical protein
MKHTVAEGRKESSFDFSPPNPGVSGSAGDRLLRVPAKPARPSRKCIGPERHRRCCRIYFKVQSHSSTHRAKSRADLNLWQDSNRTVRRACNTALAADSIAWSTVTFGCVLVVSQPELRCVFSGGPQKIDVAVHNPDTQPLDVWLSGQDWFSIWPVTQGPTQLDSLLPTVTAQSR